jgi:hypothetical protein
MLNSISQMKSASGVFNLKFFDNCTDTLVTTESHIDLTIKISLIVVVSLFAKLPGYFLL